MNDTSFFLSNRQVQISGQFLHCNNSEHLSNTIATTHNSVDSFTPYCLENCIYIFFFFFWGLSTSPSISDHSFVAAGERKRESQIFIICANSFLVNSFFASLFFPRCTAPSDTAKSSHGARLLSLSHACQDLLTHISRLAHLERSKVTELSAVINVIQIRLLPYTDVGDFSIETMIFCIP